MGFLDFLLSILNVVCGGSSPPDEKPSGVQKPPRPHPPPQTQAPLPSGAWPTLPSQAQRPAGRHDYPPDHQQSQHDSKRYQVGLGGP
ncbi:hypothetical protein K503DRAFT_377550 [Rhizopogon vinicolor AM-OR11-026]|uniref:Uncharacterized protein n=1 Tax=Rhizopogon vinicolor AM-OR11-026 TaxID=1314800 RepID=A0A1B7MRS1_9AGAM|nr:hypothetical protein K503DRAFT_377550 [Rhizopogon vinicolor AM-OR11-026]